MWSVLSQGELCSAQLARPQALNRMSLNWSMSTVAASGEDFCRRSSGTSIVFSRRVALVREQSTTRGSLFCSNSGEIGGASRFEATLANSLLK
jgi:hypothetical protein